MKYLDEYREQDPIKKYTCAIKQITSKHWRIMEVCGGQTHAILRYGIDELLPPLIELIHGPGCPVCVTPIALIDKAIDIAQHDEVILCSFGDMLRVPGTKGDLLQAKSLGADVRIVYSPLDALKIAKGFPDKQVVFFAVGFETTAPANAMAVDQAFRSKLHNFSILVSHVLVPPAMEAILSSTQNQVQGFLAAGHVCTVMGFLQYETIVQKYQVPIVVTGFEPLDILQGLYMCISQLEKGQARLENQYTRSVTRKGNLKAQELMKKVFCVVHRKWRGIGQIPESGLGLNDEYSFFDAEKRFGMCDDSIDENTDCMSGLVLQGVIKPVECMQFGSQCTPDHPLGATMVSSEGACAAYYRYRGKSR